MFDLSDGRRYDINIDSDGNVELTIRKVTSSDEGLYYCLAQSTSGRTKCSASLRVLCKLFYFILFETVLT